MKILRATTTYQVTERLGLRNITEFDSLNKKLDFNMLATFRINAGTVFFVGYDDHYRRANLIEGDPDGNGIEEQLFFNGKSTAHESRDIREASVPASLLSTGAGFGVQARGSCISTPDGVRV